MKTMRKLTTILLATLFPVLTCAAEQQETLTPYQWQSQQKVAFEQSEKIYADALKRDGLLAQYQTMQNAYRADPGKAFRIVFGQYVSWYQSFIGDYLAADASYSIRQPAEKDDAPSPLAGGYTAKPALDAIAELAKGHKAIFLNEAHNVAITRSLTVQLLPRLRAEGYTWFAAETLYDSDTGLGKRGYPIAKSGFYTMEPIAAEMVRSALKLGFKVVAYESDRPGNGDVREDAQAKNLYQRVFKQDPNARLVVNAGYAHIKENGRYLGGLSMEQHFHRLSGIDPLTVEQTMMIDHPRTSENHPYYHAVMDTLHPLEPIVFENKDGKPWSLKPDGYDVSVFFPPDRVESGRPTWLALGGLRQPYQVDGNFCAKKFPCLIEARYANEGDDAIPADRLVLDPVKGAQAMTDRIMVGTTQTSENLYLRPGKYHLSATNEANQVIQHQTITVGDAHDGRVPGDVDKGKQASVKQAGVCDATAATAIPLPDSMARRCGDADE